MPTDIETEFPSITVSCKYVDDNLYLQVEARDTYIIYDFLPEADNNTSEQYVRSSIADLSVQLANDLLQYAIDIKSGKIDIEKLRNGVNNGSIKISKSESTATRSSGSHRHKTD